MWASLVEVLDRLVAGDVIKIRVTIPEGLTLREIAARVAAAGIGTPEQFIKAASDLARLGKLGVTGKNLEGYLFPETYTVTTTTTSLTMTKRANQTTTRATKNQMPRDYESSTDRRRWAPGAACCFSRASRSAR